ILLVSLPITSEIERDYMPTPEFKRERNRSLLEPIGSRALRTGEASQMLWYPCTRHLLVGIEELGQRYRPTRVRLFGQGAPRYVESSHRLRRRRFDSEDEAAKAAILELERNGYVDHRLRIRAGRSAAGKAQE